MAYICKTTMCFSGLQQGWSETFYWPQDNTDLTIAAGAIAAVSEKRAGLLSKSYTLEVVRNAFVLQEPNTKLRRVSDVIRTKYAGVQAWADAGPNSCLNVEWQTPSTDKQKIMYLGGIPSGLIADGTKVTSGPATWGSRFQGWTAALQALGAGWLTVSSSTDAVVNDWVMNPNTGQVTFTLANPGLAWPVGVGRQIRVAINLPSKNPLDGQKVVVVQSATSCYTVDPVGVQPHQAGQVGTMKIQAFAFVSVKPVPPETRVGLITAVVVGTHKRGRPTYAKRGRAPAKPQW